MNRKSTTLLILFLMTAIAAYAQTSEIELRKSQTSGIEFFTTNHGIFGSNTGNGQAGLAFPRGSNRSYIFGSGLWFGGRKSVGDSLVDLSFITYNPNSGNSWATPGGWTRDTATRLTYSNYMAYSPEYDRTTGAWALNSAPRPAWPLWNDGETAARLSNPGTFIPDTAERTPSISGMPAFVPGVAEQYFSRYHDGQTSRYEGERRAEFPIGLQIEQNIYGFAGSGLDNVVILHYRIINVSDDTLFDCYSAQASDPDLGTASNDYGIHYYHRPGLASGYAYSSSNSSGDSKFGTLVQTVLESPAVDNNRASSRYRFIRHDRRDYDSAEQIGLASFRNWTIANDPRGPDKRYRFMASDTFDVAERAGDARTLLAVGPFNMLPGDTARFAVAFTIVPDLFLPGTRPQPKIEAAAERVLALYRERRVSGVRAANGTAAGLSIGALRPNPAIGRTTIELHLPRRTAPRVELVDPLGQVVLARNGDMLEAGDHLVSLDLSGLASGIYMVSVETGGERVSRPLVISR